MVATLLLTILAAWGCKEQVSDDEVVVTKVDLGSYAVTKHVMDLKHDYQVLSAQEGGGYLLNAPKGEAIKVNAAGELQEHSSLPKLLGRYGSAQAISPDQRVYKVDNAVWTMKGSHLQRYEDSDDDDEHEWVSELNDRASAQLNLFWLSPRRIVGFGEYKIKSCTTQAACLKKGVQLFELNGKDEIVNTNVPIAIDSSELEGERVIGGFKVLSDGSKSFWLWSTTGELLYVKEELNQQAGKAVWKKWQYALKFSNLNADVKIVEFDFALETSPDDGLMPPKYIAIIAKDKNDKLGLYTAQPN